MAHRFTLRRGRFIVVYATRSLAIRHDHASHLRHIQLGPVGIVLGRRLT